VVESGNKIEAYIGHFARYRVAVAVLRPTE